MQQAKNRYRLGALARWSAALAIGLASIASPAVAQTYPSRAITLIVPVNPGGPLDMLARLVAPPLGKLLGQAIIVENRAGASQKIGIQKLLHSPKDGYTIALVSPASMTINPLIDKAIGYDPLKDFTFLTEAVGYPFVLAVNPSVPVKSVPQLVAYVKAHPNKLAYGTGGSGTIIHFATQQLLQKLGITILPVHYKGDGPALMALLADQVQLMVAGTGAAKPFIAKGQLVPLATTGAERLADFPNVPTYSQTGIKALDGFTSTAWLGVVAANGIPPDVTKKLYDALAKALKTPEVRKSLEAAGFQVLGSTPAEFAAMVRTSLEGNRKVIESGAIKAE